MKNLGGGFTRPDHKGIQAFAYALRYDECRRDPDSAAYGMIDAKAEPSRKGGLYEPVPNRSRSNRYHSCMSVVGVGSKEGAPRNL